MIENPKHWRISISGNSIKTGWADEKRIIASYPSPGLVFDAEHFAEWLDNAAHICDLHNAWVDAQ
jgi:hypothetical protein